MCSEFKLIDSISLLSPLNVDNAICASRDVRYGIIVEDGIYILHLCGLMNNAFPTLSFKKSFVKLPEYNPSSNFEIDISTFLTDLPQHDLYESLLNLNISENVVATKPQVIHVEWSPLGLIDNDHCALAALTNTGFICIMMRVINEVELERYFPVANITKASIEYFKPMWKSAVLSTSSAKLKELRQRIDEALPTAFTWSHLLTHDNKQFCIVIVGHLNGGISLWRIDKRNSNDISEIENVKIMAYLKLEQTEKIVTLHWQQSNKNGLLFVSDLKGQLLAISVKDITAENVTFGPKISLWNESDHIKIERIKLFVCNNMIYVVAIKGSTLLVYLIGETGEVLDNYKFHVGEYKITGLEHYEENIFILTTYAGIVKEFKLSCKDDHKICIEWRPLYVDYKWSSYQTYGFVISPNKIFFAVLVGILNLNTLRRTKDPTKLLIFMNTAKNALDILRNNNSGCLTNHWDCLELLRLLGSIEKSLPCMGIPKNLNYDILSLVQLKTCSWLIKASEMLFSKVSMVVDKKTFRYDELQYAIKIKLAAEHVSHLLDLLAKRKTLDTFHMQSLDILNMFLKEVINKDVIPQIGLGMKTIENLYHLIDIANKLCYPPLPICKWCHESLNGLTCNPAHVDNRCNISFMQIQGLPYYKCPFCECLVHHKLKEVLDVILCPYCDVPLDYVNVLIATNRKEDVKEKRNIRVKDLSKLLPKTDKSEK